MAKVKKPELPPFCITGIPNLVYAERMALTEGHTLGCFVEFGVCEFPSAYVSYNYYDMDREITDFTIARGRNLPPYGRYTFKGAFPCTVLAYGRLLVPRCEWNDLHYRYQECCSLVYVGWSLEDNLIYRDGLAAKFAVPTWPNVDRFGGVCTGLGTVDELVPLNVSMAAQVDQWWFATGNPEINCLETVSPTWRGEFFYKWEEDSRESSAKGAEFLYKESQSGDAMTEGIFSVSSYLDRLMRLLKEEAKYWAKPQKERR